jgi:hypothetical protein
MVRLEDAICGTFVLASSVITCWCRRRFQKGLVYSQSVGGSQSERSGSGDQTPMPKGGSSSDDKTKAEKKASKSQLKTKQDKSIGGSKSERSTGGTPLPEGSRYSGEENKSPKKPTPKD